MDVDDPLFWDLLWFGVFGVLPLVLGWLMRRSPGNGSSKVMNSPLALLLAVAVARPLAAVPPPNDGTVMVLFAPGTSPQQALAAMQSVDGRLLWTDASGQLWAIDVSSGGDPAGLYGKGAMLVSNSILPAGCFDWLSV